jgi:hypothetical protein
MFNKHIFAPERLGSEKEEKTLVYDGWTILADINAQNYAQIIQWAKCTFHGDGIEFNEQKDRFFISYGSDDRAAEIIPDKIKYKDADHKRAVTYNLIIKSDFFGFKQFQEYTHQNLFYKIEDKIPKKRGFFVREGKRFKH